MAKVGFPTEQPCDEDAGTADDGLNKVIRCNWLPQGRGMAQSQPIPKNRPPSCGHCSEIGIRSAEEYDFPGRLLRED